MSEDTENQIKAWTVFLTLGMVESWDKENEGHDKAKEHKKRLRRLLFLALSQEISGLVIRNKWAASDLWDGKSHRQITKIIGDNFDFDMIYGDTILKEEGKRLISFDGEKAAALPHGVAEEMKHVRLEELDFDEAYEVAKEACYDLGIMRKRQENVFETN